MQKITVTYQLFANPSFIEGMASVLDLGATLHSLYNTSDTDHEADTKALFNDWCLVGNDMRISISKYEQGLLIESTK